MHIAIAQPTYLPWLGYFDLIDQVDTFVVLDTVQFEKQSWQQRNRIKTPTGLQWLTVPVIFRGRLEQRIKNVEIRDASFSEKHLRTLELNYSRAPHFRTHFATVCSLLKEMHDGTRLIDLNLRLLRWFFDLLDIRTPLILASCLAQEGKRTQLLANICQKLGATQYLSPIGSAEYLLSEMDFFCAVNVEVLFHNYEHPEYKQLFPPFVPYASTIDLIFNEGDRAMEIIRSGRNQSFSAQAVAAKLAAPAPTAATKGA
jgi:WbqC-like protein family